MTNPLFEDLDGFYAWDLGMRDSGIHHPELRKLRADEIDAMDKDELRRELSIFIRESCLSDEALAQGYGWEDALAFLVWFNDGEYQHA